jgi:hypothetical protein
MRRITRFHPNGPQLCCWLNRCGIAFQAHFGGFAIGLMSAAAVLPKASPEEPEIIIRPKPLTEAENVRSILVISMSNIYAPVLTALALFACVTAFAFHRLAMPEADVGR